jgi:hypothetical protein
VRRREHESGRAVAGQSQPDHHLVGRRGQPNRARGGARVLFINNHTQRHQMSSDPHPEHTDCPEIDQVGLLSPGQNRETGNLVAVRTCGFHDHENPDHAALRGRIVIR